MRLLLTFLVALMAAGATAQDTGQTETLGRVIERGALLYAYDQAAWHGTDDMLVKLKDPADKLGGYIVDGPATDPRLIFYDKAGQSAVYIATFKRNRLIEGRVLGDNEDRTLSELDRRMILALGAARTALFKDKSVRACAPTPFNTVVLPPESDGGPISVYFLTAQTDTATIPFGGHFKIEVDAQGSAGKTQRFSRSCLDMPRRPDLPAGTKPEAMFVTHLLGSTPTEVHVFNSLALGTPVMVITVPTKMIWPVTGANIGRPVPVPAEP